VHGGQYSHNKKRKMRGEERKRSIFSCVNEGKKEKRRYFFPSPSPPVPLLAYMYARSGCISVVVDASTSGHFLGAVLL